MNAGKSMMGALRILILLAAGYVLIFCWIWIRQEKLIFIPCRYEADPFFQPMERVFAVNGVKLQGWFIDKDAEHTVIYYGGNGEDLSGSLFPLCEGLQANALLVNYRGYGTSEGKPGEAKIFSDALAVFDSFAAEKDLEPGNIVVMGRSLGSAVATYVAAERNVRRVVLITPFDSITSVGQGQYPYLPISWVIRHPFDALSRAPKIEVPTLVLLAEYDRVAPPANSRRLIKAWNGNIEEHTLPATDHNSINEHPDYWPLIDRFVTGSGVAE